MSLQSCSVSRLATIPTLFLLTCLLLAPALSSAQGLLGDLLADRVVTVDVWAADKKGRSVAGLTADDFELFDNGQPVEITEVVPGSGPLRLILYFDNPHTQTEGRNRIIEDLSKTLEHGLGTDTQVMIVTYDGSLTFRQPFTADMGVVTSALKQVAAEVSSGDAVESERKALLGRLEGTKGDCESAIPSVRAHAKIVYDGVDRSLGSLETLARSLSTLEGRKAILYISDGLELFSGQAAFGYLATECGGNQQTMEQLAQEYDSSGSLIRLAAVANSKDTTIVAVEAIGPLSSSAGRAKAKQKPSAGKQPTGMVMKSADGVPMVPVAGLGDSGSGKPTLEQIRTRNLQSSMAYLANQTGGVTVFSTKNFKTPLETLSQDLLPYYSLEFEPDWAPDGNVHVLEVHTAKKGIETRYNKSFFDQRASRDYGDRLLAYLIFQTDEPNRLGVQIEVPQAEDTAKGFHTAQIAIQLASVVLRPHQGELVGRLNFLAVSQNARGETTQLQQTTADIAPMPGATEHVQQFPIEMLPGDQILAVAVVDVGGAMASFAKQEVTIP